MTNEARGEENVWSALKHESGKSERKNYLQAVVNRKHLQIPAAGKRQKIYWYSY